MAIASTEPEPAGIPGIILVAIRAMIDDLINFEKTMRQKGIITLQKKTLEVNSDEAKLWFTEEWPDEETLAITGYVIQSHNVKKEWKDITQEYGGNVCGIAPDDDLRRFFPSVVLDDYLLQPNSASEYLYQLKPTLLAGLQDICEKKPDDPVNHLANFLKNASAL